jgi:hypothetical protein
MMKKPKGGTLAVKNTYPERCQKAGLNDGVVNVDDCYFRCAGFDSRVHGFFPHVKEV